MDFSHWTVKQSLLAPLFPRLNYFPRCGQAHAWCITAHSAYLKKRTVFFGVNTNFLGWLLFNRLSLIRDNSSASIANWQHQIKPGCLSKVLSDSKCPSVWFKKIDIYRCDLARKQRYKKLILSSKRTVLAVILWHEVLQIGIVRGIK